MSGSINDMFVQRNRQPQRHEQSPENVIGQAAAQAQNMLDQGVNGQDVASQAFPYIPPQIMGDPYRILDYLHQNSSKLNPLQQMVLGMMYRR